MLGACKQCGKSVSDKAVRCPHCGLSTPFVFSQPPEGEHGSENVGPRESDQENAEAMVLAAHPNEAVAPTGWTTSIFYVCCLLFLVAVVFVFVAVQHEIGSVAPSERIETQATTRFASSDHPSTIHSGNAEEQVNQGLSHYYGRGVAQNYSEAARLFRLAADQGNADGQNNLGIMYESGLGVTQDYAEARRLYQLAANQGNANAQDNLSRFAQALTTAPPDAQLRTELNEGDCMDISIRQGMGAGERCRAQVAGRPQVGLNEGDCVDISIRQGMGAGERCRAQVAGRPQVGLNEGDCMDISIRQGMGAGERCRAQLSPTAPRY